MYHNTLLNGLAFDHDQDADAIYTLNFRILSTC